jgi:hypothetical protein
MNDPLLALQRATHAKEPRCQHHPAKAKVFGQVITLAMPVSSSSVEKITPFALPGRCRISTMPATFTIRFTGKVASSFVCYLWRICAVFQAGRISSEFGWALVGTIASGRSRSSLIKISLPLLGGEAALWRSPIEMCADLFMPPSAFQNRFLGAAHPDVSPHH